MSPSSSSISGHNVITGDGEIGLNVDDSYDRSDCTLAFIACCSANVNRCLILGAAKF